MRPGSALFGARPVLFIHDEIICEILEERAPEGAEELARIMVESMRPYIPDLPICADPWVSRQWKKGLDTVRENGRLVIQN